MTDPDDDLLPNRAAEPSAWSDTDGEAVRALLSRIGDRRLSLPERGQLHVHNADGSFFVRALGDEAMAVLIDMLLGTGHPDAEAVAVCQADAHQTEVEALLSALEAAPCP